jgi:cell filamentation protein
VRNIGVVVWYHNGMSRYQPAIGPEAESEPGSRGLVLRNKLGITTKREMDQVEYDALIDAQKRLVVNFEDDVPFTAQFIRDMHRSWLGGIYEWAGQYRSVELSKDGFHWPPAFRVAQNMAHFDDGLLRRFTPCRPASAHEVSRAIAEVHAESLLIHPFREGNGRVARWLADLMALQAGLPLPKYPFEGRGSVAGRKQYLAAVKRGYLGDFDLLVRFFVEAIERRSDG